MLSPSLPHLSHTRHRVAKWHAHHACDTIQTVPLNAAIFYGKKAMESTLAKLTCQLPRPELPRHKFDLFEIAYKVNRGTMQHTNKHTCVLLAHLDMHHYNVLHILSLVRIPHPNHNGYVYATDLRTRWRFQKSRYQAAKLAHSTNRIVW